MTLEKYKKVGTQQDAYYFVTAIELSGESDFNVRWRGIFTNDTHSGTLDATRFRFWVHPGGGDEKVDRVTVTFHDIEEPFGKGEFEATFSAEDLRRFRDTIDEVLAEIEAAEAGAHLQLDEKYRSTPLPSGRLTGLYRNPRFL